MKEIRLTNSGEVAIVDDEDFSSLSMWKWMMNTHGYAVRGRTFKRDGVKTSRHRGMHTEILGEKEGYVCDHINHNRLDNRRSNLRFATFSQNQINRIKSNSTGFRGVSKEHGTDRWRARSSFQYKRKEIGGFKTPEEAALAYDNMAKETHGEFAVLNFP